MLFYTITNTNTNIDTDSNADNKKEAVTTAEQHSHSPFTIHHFDMISYNIHKPELRIG